MNKTGGSGVEGDVGTFDQVRKVSRRGFVTAGMAMVGGFGGIDAVALEPNWLRVRKYRVGEGFLGVRVAQFSDTHYRGDDAQFERVVATLRKIDPDFVCFTGDLVEEHRHVARALQWVRRIPFPVFGVPGNHDWRCGADFYEFSEAFGATGGAWLMDQSMVYSEVGIELVGVATEAPPPPQDSEAFQLILMHYPAWVKHITGRRGDLILAGHSHGGQVRLPGIGAMIVPDLVEGYELGWYRDTPMGDLYVNPGIGTTRVPLRLNCRPEITVFDL